MHRNRNSTTDCFKICELYHHHVQLPPCSLYERHPCVGSFPFPSNDPPTLKKISEQSGLSWVYLERALYLSPSTLYEPWLGMCLFLGSLHPASYWGFPFSRNMLGRRIYHVPWSLFYAFNTSISCVERRPRITKLLYTHVAVQLKKILLFWTPIFLSKAL